MKSVNTLIANRYWRNDYRDYISVLQLVDPAAFGFPPERGRRWQDSAWHRFSIVDGSPNGRFVDAVKAYGKKYRDALRRGFLNKLDGGETDLEFAFER